MLSGHPHLYYLKQGTVYFVTFTCKYLQKCTGIHGNLSLRYILPALGKRTLMLLRTVRKSCLQTVRQPFERLNIPFERLHKTFAFFNKPFERLLQHERSNGCTNRSNGNMNRSNGNVSRFKGNFTRSNGEINRSKKISKENCQRYER